MNDGYQFHTVDNLGEVAPFGMWLQERSRQETPVAVALHRRLKRICFSDRDDGWVLDLKSEVAPLAAGVLRQQIVQQGTVRLLTRNLRPDLADLSKFLSERLGLKPIEMYRHLEACIVGDLTTAAHCINQTVTPPHKFRKLEQDAYEIALLEPQYAYGIPAYYQKIGLPLAKLFAESQLSEVKTPEWYAVYPDMWLRVLAYYSGDPTLSYAFYEGRDPVATLAQTMGMTPEDAEILLLYQACGRDISVFVKRFGDLAQRLPDHVVADNTLDRGLPTLVARCNDMMRAYADTRSVETLYGRRMRPGHPLGEAVAFRIFGTVEEITSVAAVTFWQNRPGLDTMIKTFEGGPAARTIRIAGVGPRSETEKQVWLTQMKSLATLADPLGQMPLKPVVLDV